jgi:hypothetical protein
LVDDSPDQLAEPAHAHHDHGAVLERLGLRSAEHTAVEIDLPIEGPAAHWEWLQMHGNRWLYDALPESDCAEFRRRVLGSLHDHHPAGGTRLIAGAGFERLVRR